MAFSYIINSLRPSDAYMRQQFTPSLVQIMACRLFGAKPLSEPMKEYCQLDPPRRKIIGSASVFGLNYTIQNQYSDVIIMKKFPHHWPFVWGIYKSPLNSSHKGRWRGALLFSLFCTWTNGYVNNQYVGDSRRHRAHCGVTVMDLIGPLWYQKLGNWGIIMT